MSTDYFSPDILQLVSLVNQRDNTSDKSVVEFDFEHSNVSDCNLHKH